MDPRIQVKLDIYIYMILDEKNNQKSLLFVQL